MNTATATRTITFHGYDRRYADSGDNVIDIVRSVAQRDEFILGASVAELERLVAARVGVQHAAAVANGTGALVLGLSALGIGPGDEVITPAFSFISSASAPALLGARPAFADVDYDTGLLDPGAVEAAVTPATRGMIAVHLFNRAAPMRVLGEIGRREGLAVIEDAAVAFGATVDGAPAGSHGDVGVFSFFPGKPIGGIGDAGMVVTDDPALAALCRMRRNHGQDLSTRFLHHSIGWNCRMDEIVAEFLVRRLPRLDGWLERRRHLAGIYNDALAPLAPEILTPPGDLAGRAVYLYVIRAQERDRLRAHLANAGIETGLYYPRPLHLQPVFASLGHREGDFPVAERLARECLALPLHPELGDGDVAYVAACVADFVHGRTRGAGA